MRAYIKRTPSIKMVELTENSNSLDKFNHTFLRIAKELAPWGFVRGRPLRRELLLRGKAFTFRLYFCCEEGNILRFGVYVQICSDRLEQWHLENYSDTNHQLGAGEIFTLPLRALVDGKEGELYDINFEVDREQTIRTIVTQTQQILYPYFERFEEDLIGLVDQVAREGFVSTGKFVTDLNFLLCFGNEKKAVQGMESFFRARPEYRALYEEYRREEPLNFMISKQEYGMMMKEMLYNGIEVDFDKLGIE